MGKKYPIMLGNNAIGEATVTEQGLYYCIYCKCTLSGEVLYRVSMASGEQKENLGILVPEGGFYVSSSRIPIKRIGNGTYHFFAVPKHQKPDTDWVRLKPEEPFKYIARLDDAYLHKRNNVSYVSFMTE